MKPTTPKQIPKPILTGTADRERLYQQTMTNIRYQLPKGQGSMSRFLHGHLVEIVTEFLEETVFRPSIVLGGLTGALIITSAWYAYARIYGFVLSGSELPLSFVLGAVIGFGIERLGQLFRPRE